MHRKRENFICYFFGYGIDGVVVRGVGVLFMNRNGIEDGVADAVLGEELGEFVSGFGKVFCDLYSVLIKDVARCDLWWDYAWDF